MAIPRIGWQPAIKVLAVPWGKPTRLLSLEEGPDHCRPVRLLGRRAQDSRSSQYG